MTTYLTSDPPARRDNYRHERRNVVNDKKKKRNKGRTCLVIWGIGLLLLVLAMLMPAMLSFF